MIQEVIDHINLAEQLKLELGDEQEISLVTFGKEKPITLKTPTTKINLPLKDGTQLLLTVNVVPKITGGIQRMPIDTKIFENHLWKDLQLADSLPTQTEKTQIDLLLGNDYYLDIIEPVRMELKPGLFLLGSKLGWILTGRTQVDVSASDTMMPALLVHTYSESKILQPNCFSLPDSSMPTTPSLEDFWSLEKIGITDTYLESDDMKAMQDLSNSIKYEDSRYWVTWPWKETEIYLPENFELAKGRLKSLVHKLQRNPELLRKYDDIIRDQTERNVIEKVEEETSESRKHYIPHHAVVTPSKTTTKVRVVYDASARTQKDNPSLNDCLYRGPVILENLCGLLMRFRFNEVAILADIKKAFLQVGLQARDRDVTRFLWLKDITDQNIKGNVQIYRFCRVPFGVVSSPFLLAGTIQHHLQNESNSIAEKIKDSLYVDNVITGTQDVSQALQFYSESKRVFTKASMNLREWTSNSEDFMCNIPQEDRATGRIVKVLGMIWHVVEDILKTRSEIDITNPASKRDVLRAISSIYDPLGLFIVATVEAKLFVQTLWMDNLDWDDSLSSERQMKWENIAKELQFIEMMKVPRHIPVSEQDHKELVCFTDASESVYAAVVYILTFSKGICANLIFSKLRLAPMKKLSIPRLELLGVLIGVRCLSFVESELKQHIHRKILYTDSQCVLKWLTSTKSLSVFVTNRLKEIKAADIHFRYVASADNPADIATRGITPENLQNFSLWWKGPDWLTTAPETWPTWNVDEVNRKVIEAIESEYKDNKVMYEAGLTATDKNITSPPLGIDDAKFSSLKRLIRVTAWCLRFVTRLRKQGKDTGPLNAKELSKAKVMWELFVQERGFSETIVALKCQKPSNLAQQLGLLVDDNGILRCKGRLTHAGIDEDARLPKLLPNKDNYTRLVIHDTHKRLFHAGVSHTLAQVRSEYWILKGRASVKEVLKGCRTCRKWEGGPYKMPSMPPLPSQRVTQSHPFTHTGLDYFGPLYIRDNSGSRKVWVCLFTCLVVRAVHLELIRDMTSEQFLLCMRRFIARHGTPHSFISDNASQFKLAKNVITKAWIEVEKDTEVQDYVSQKGIEWHFIKEMSPWMGGCYERMVGLAKRALRKTLGALSLTHDQLQTVLMEIASVINSRPLIYVTDDLNSNNTLLTLAHFLTMNTSTGIPESGDVTDPEYLQKMSSTQRLLDAWKLV